MMRNWNIVRARLVDPFEPDWERVDQQVQAMIVEQDAHGGHIYPPFRLPNLVSYTCVPPRVSPLFPSARLSSSMLTRSATAS